MSVGIIPCQVTSNTGTMTTKSAMEKIDGKKIKTVCSLGLPLGIEGIIKNAKTNETYITLNGCPVKCASKALESIGIDSFEEINITELEIQKSKDLNDETDIDKVKEKVDEVLSRI